MGKKERERIQSMVGPEVSEEQAFKRRKPREDLDEIARERGVILINEGRGEDLDYPVYAQAVF